MADGMSLSMTIDRRVSSGSLGNFWNRERNEEFGLAPRADWDASQGTGRQERRAIWWDVWVKEGIQAPVVWSAGQRTAQPRSEVAAKGSFQRSIPGRAQVWTVRRSWPVFCA
jgi:hypothetical protein